MPRPRRVHIEGALYMITSRATEGKLLFEDGGDYENFLELLKEYQQQMKFKLYGYVLFPDHIHLCLEPTTKEGTVSVIMHALNSRYTKLFSKRHGHTPHLFEGRFKSTLLEKEPYLVRATGYLHWHPVRTGPAAMPKDYPWSSYLYYFRTDQGKVCAPAADDQIPRLEIQEVLDGLHVEYPGSSYEQFVHSVPEEEWEKLRTLLHKPALGSASFLAHVERMAKGQTVPSKGAPEPKPEKKPVEPDLPPEPTYEEEEELVPVPVRPQPRQLHQWVLAGSVTMALLVTTMVGMTVFKKGGAVPGKGAVVQMATSISRGIGIGEARMTSNGFVMPASLEGTRWQVQMKAAGSGNVTTDQLTFEGSKIFSTRLAAQGFSESNYSLKTQNDGAMRWETMQRGPKGQMVFWRGESDGRVIRGVMILQDPESGTENFSFLGTLELDEGVKSREPREI